MAKARKRFYKISPSWAGAHDVGLLTDGWVLAPLTTATPFADLEQEFGETIPTSGQFAYHKRPNAIPDLVEASAYNPIVTAAFKSVVEAMAPGEAEFRPFAMRWPDDDPVAGDWYLMNILNMPDCFDFEHMGKPRPSPPIRRPTGEAMSDKEIAWQIRLNHCVPFGPYYVDATAVEGLHIWRPLFQPDAIFCTGELLKALKAAPVRRLHAERVGTRDDPLKVWDWAALGVRPPGSPL